MSRRLCLSLVGELQDLGLSDIFQILALSQRTGTLMVTTPQYVGQVLFASGAIVGGGLSPHTETLGQAFVAAGAVAPSAIEAAVGQELRGAHGSQGAQMLQQLGSDPAVFLTVMEEVLRGMMARLLSACEGSFSFESAASIDPWAHFSLAGTMAVCPKGLKAQYLAMEAMRERDEAGRGPLPPPAQQAHAAASRPHKLARALMGEDGPKEDDWSALLLDSDSAAAVPKTAAPATTAPVSSPLTHLRDVVQALRELPQGTDPSALLLRALRLHCERGAYFELRAGTLVGRSGYGQAPGGDAVAPQVARAAVEVPHNSPLSPVLRAHGVVVQDVCAKGDHCDLLHALGGAWQFEQPMLLAPWRVRGQVVGLLVGDNPSGMPLTDAPGVEILLGVASSPPPVRT